MKLDKLLLFSGAFLALVIACHALQDVECKSEIYDTNSEPHSANIKDHYVTVKAHLKAVMKLCKLLLLSSGLLVSGLYILYYMTSKSEAHSTNTEGHFATATVHIKAKKWPEAIATCKMIADAYASDAIAFMRKNDAVKAIEAYECAANVHSQIAVIARDADLLIDAIKSCKQEAQLYEKAAQLCREASNAEEEALLHTRIAIAYKELAIICRQLAHECSSKNDRIGQVLAYLKVGNAYMDSANWFSSASDIGNAIAMYKLAAEAFAIVANIFRVENSFDQEAVAWIHVVEADTLSALLYWQIDDALNAAAMYAIVADSYMAAVSAYTNAGDTERTAEAYQQTVTWRTIAGQIYHDARAHESEAHEYTETARQHRTLKEHALAGRALELAGQAYQRAQKYLRALTTFQGAQEDYTAAKDPVAVQRMQNAVVACDLTTRSLYYQAVGQLSLKRKKLTSQIVLRIHRSHLLQDSYEKIMGLASCAVQSTRYEIAFLDEEADDRGDSSHEWFSLLAKEMINPKHAFFISQNPSDQTYQPNPSKHSIKDLNYHRFFGRVLAMAINSGNLVHFRLTEGFLKHMLRQTVLFEDLSTFDPVLYHSYVKLKQATDLSGMELYFSVHINDKAIELCPDGNNRPVTLDNRDEYIRLAANYYLTTQIQAQLIAFLSGFNLFIYRDCIASLNTLALTWLINGESTLSVDDWEDNTLYEGYSETSMPVIWFWSTMSSFSPEQHAKLLHFVTGSSLVPLGGFSKLDPKFTIARIEQNDGHIPSATIVLHKLNLPNYSTKAILRDKLLYAIEHGQGSFDFV